MLRKIGTFLVFAILFGFSFSVVAQEAIGEKGLTPDVQKWIAIAAGFGIAIAAFGGALGQGKAISAAVEGIARNPQASGKIFTPMIVGLALIESLVLYTFVIAIMLFLKI